MHLYLVDSISKNSQVNSSINNADCHTSIIPYLKLTLLYMKLQNRLTGTDARRP